MIGVYIFKDKNKKILYIGKALDLKKRIKNHFNQPTYKDKLFINKIDKAETLETDSEIEALILESQLIKKHRPKFNYVWKDDKNYFYVAITKGKLPYIFITHRPSPLGPFVDGKALRQTLKFMRKVFPYYTARKHPRNKCPWCHLNLCPGPDPDLAKYRKDLGNLKSFLKGKKKAVFRNLKKEMQKASSEQNYELANEIKNKVFALEKILANAKVINRIVDLGLQ
jgi:excinuclease ABC subunit C